MKKEPGIIPAKRVTKELINRYSVLIGAIKFEGKLFEAKYNIFQSQKCKMFAYYIQIRYVVKRFKTQISYKLIAFSGAVKFAKSTDPNKNGYNCYGIGFYVPPQFLLQNDKWGKSVAIFSMDNDLSRHTDDNGKA